MALSSQRRAITVARLLYLIVSIFVGVVSAYLISNLDFSYSWIGLLGGLCIGGLFILIESLSKQFSIRGFSTATFGLCIGFFCAWLLQTVQLPEIFVQALALNKIEIDGRPLATSVIIMAFNFVLFSSLGYLGTVLALRTNQDEFSIVIPFIRFQQENVRGRPIVCSIDILIDGRLPNLIASHFINYHVILPPFAIEELQAYANSPSSTKNLQGKRGLTTLDELRTNSAISITTHQFEVGQAKENHDVQTILTCKQLNARLLTCDDNLAQVAKVQDIKVLNLKTLASAMKPQVEVGQKLNIAIVKPGKEEHQGVGYLPDGTMIVVNNGAKLMGSNQNVTVISTIQTSAGLMVFTELDDVG